MANPRWAESSVPRYLPDRVAQIYYAHGLFCSSHPVFVIILTSIIILLSSFPLTYLPLPGNVPQSFSTHASRVNVTTPRWFNGPSKYYIQQVILKSTVSPWTEDLLLTDAFRSPLAESFKLTEIIRNYQLNNHSLSLDKICLHIENIRRKTNKMTSVLPEYNCLVLSPGNLWTQDINKFQLDANLINTVYNYQNYGKGKISISEMCFGLPLKEAGIKRYPLRNKQRVIQFAVTIFITQHHTVFIEDLRTYLKKFYPLSESLTLSSNNSSQSSIHIYYPEDVNYGELIPLSLTYLMLFLYIYFLVRKMDFIKYKMCMAFSVVLTVLASLSVTIGICFFFGLEFSGKERGKQVFPYLVIIVGLENVLVLMKSVVSTTSHLDVKIRVAQGLSKEGWNITKIFLIEVTILTAGLLTFVPAIQEFCIFAIVGLLSDLFLQTVFFVTILSLNIKSTEQSTYPNYAYHSLNTNNPMGKNNYVNYGQNLEDSRKLSRSRSHPRLTGQNVVAPLRNHKALANQHVPKRMKVVHFWARTRFVQRSFMVGMVLWIGVIIYNADTIQNFIKRSADTEVTEISPDEDFRNSNEPVTWKNEHVSMLNSDKLQKGDEEAKKLKLKEELRQNDNISEEFYWVKKVDYDTRRRLSLYHWPSILSLYNVSLSGSYITLLPPITLIHSISSESAVSMRNPDEKGIKFRWQSLAAALDPIDFPDVESTMRSTIPDSEERVRPFIPSSPMEIFMTALLCIVSVFVVAYTFVVLYRCMCTRNYAEWRSSWASSSNDESSSPTQVVLEALPITIEGHAHLIECVSSDNNVIVSTCLGGFVKVWDAFTGELVADIERKRPTFNNQLVNAKRVNDSINMLPSLNRSNEQLYSYSNNVARSPIQSSNLHFNAQVLDRRKDENVYSFTANHITNDRSATVTNSSRNVPIWCIDCKDNIVVLGCVDGCLEFWECSTGIMKCIYVDDRISITSVKLVGYLVIVAKLNGTISFYKLEVVPSYNVPEAANGPMKHRKCHVRSGSVDSVYNWQLGESEQLRCYRIDTVKAHTKPITVLECEGNKIISGSEDRTLKVFLLENQVLLYTLHGHYGPVSCVFIDRFNPSMAGSGSQDGLLCVWDLHTGACMYSIQAHDGMITALTYSASYVISLGQDEKLCVWDRFQGHLLNTIPLMDSFCTSLCMLTHNLLITSKQGCLAVLDVGTGETIRLVKLGPTDACVFIRHIISVGDGIICDYGDQLRLVRFPFVCDKND
ncbi:sterol regulatory element-binding protein cleavage-activating protein [Planococcus citri]|uniref:sterol regulatory element-binding protein cleavage-activating protein n=1 Tax=Planococcus citri TaxID=170843 RepID=UPI0031F91BFC